MDADNEICLSEKGKRRRNYNNVIISTGILQFQTCQKNKDPLQIYVKMSLSH